MEGDTRFPYASYNDILKTQVFKKSNPNGHTTE